MNKNETRLFRYLLRLGDNALVLAQRLTEIVAHGPELEEELANANLALDYLGHARLFYSYAGELEGKDRGEDDFAFHRTEREFENLLLVEQDNGHFGDVIVRAVLFDSFYLLQLEALAECSEPRLAGIAAKAAQEVRYHLRHVSQWLVRLGDGTEESHRRVQDSLDRLWRFTGELFDGDAIDDVIHKVYGGPDLGALREVWYSQIERLTKEATLDMPEDQWMASGGREGVHSESFGYLVAEMQSMQRTYPGLDW